MIMANHKKIIIVSSFFPPHLGGLELVAYHQAKRLAEIGHDVTVITSKVDKNELSSSSDAFKLIRVRAWNGFEKFGSPFPVFSPRLIYILIKNIRKADIVHIHDAFYMSSFLAAICAFVLRKPIVLTQHVEMIPHPSSLVKIVQKIIYSTSGALIFRCSSKIINLNDRVENFLIKRRVSRDKLISLANGVDTEFFKPANSEEKYRIRNKYALDTGRKVALFVGRFVPKKGFDKLLAGRCDDFQLVFAGGKNPGNPDKNAIFLGKMPPEELKFIYQAADIFVLPSEGEGFPLTIQEAMASGLPVITTNDSGYARYGFDKKLILLIDRPTVENIKSTIKSIIFNEDRLREMSSYSRSYACEHFSWDNLITRLDDIYDKLIIKRGT
jgi:D-inositol-3-phosphate glycosyltransferase